MARRKYLGKKVKDRGRKGLDRLSEVKGIARAIVRDYKRRKTSYKTAMSRLNLLSLVAKKQARKKHVRFKYKTAKRIIDSFRKKLKALRKKK